MATEVGLRGSTYPNLAIWSAMATMSGGDVLLVGMKVPGDDGPLVKRRGRRQGRELGGEREVEDGERRRQ